MGFLGTFSMLIRGYSGMYPQSFISLDQNILRDTVLVAMYGEREMGRSDPGESRALRWHIDK